MRSKVIRLKLKSDTLAIAEEKGQRILLTIPMNHAITLSGDVTLDGSKLVEVQWAGRAVMMFARDLRERGEEIKQAASASSGF